MTPKPQRGPDPPREPAGLHLEAEQKQIEMRIEIVKRATGAPRGSTAQVSARRLPEGITQCRLQGDRVRATADQTGHPGVETGGGTTVAVTVPLAGNVVLLESSRYLREASEDETGVLDVDEDAVVEPLLIEEDVDSPLVVGRAHSKLEESPWPGCDSKSGCGSCFRFSSSSSRGWECVWWRGFLG